MYISYNQIQHNSHEKIYIDVCNVKHNVETLLLRFCLYIWGDVYFQGGTEAAIGGAL